MVSIHIDTLSIPLIGIDTFRYLQVLIQIDTISLRSTSSNEKNSSYFSFMPQHPKNHLACISDSITQIFIIRGLINKDWDCGETNYLLINLTLLTIDFVQHKLLPTQCIFPTCTAIFQRLPRAHFLRCVSVKCVPLFSTIRSRNIAAL